MRKRTILSATAAFVLGLVPGTAVMATDYAEQIWDQLQMHRDTVGLHDFRLEYFVIGYLPDDDSDFWTFHFSRGSEYVITGACDQDCTDIDLIIRNEDGDELDRDTQVDDQPVLRFRPPYSGQFEIEVRMYACNVNPCYFGFGLFKD